MFAGILNGLFIVAPSDEWNYIVKLGSDMCQTCHHTTTNHIFRYIHVLIICIYNHIYYHISNVCFRLKKNFGKISTKILKNGVKMVLKICDMIQEE